MKFKKVDKLFQFLSKLYIAYIITLVIAVFVGLFEYHTYSNIPPSYNPETDFLPSDILTTITGLVQFVLLLMVMINFFRFIHRVSKNLQFQHNQALSTTPGWTVGYFFVPILNLYKPYHAIKEIIQVSGKSEIVDTSKLGLWWGLWITSNVLGRMAVQYTIENWGSDTSPTESLIYLASDAFDIILFLVEFSMVKSIAGAYISNFESNESSEDLKEEVIAKNDDVREFKE